MKAVIGIALASVMLVAGPSGLARAQTADPPATKGPKTLLEAVLGEGSEGPKKGGSQEEDRLEPDRPHFPESARTVGLGRTMLEGGYTFTSKGGSFMSHSAPEMLLRAGVFAEWFEVRVGQSFLDQRQTIDGVTTSASGAQDLYLGVKVALTEQKGLLPTMAVIPQMTVPTGAPGITAHRVLPGVNLDLSWDIIKDFFGIELLIANNNVQDELGAIRHELATGLTGAFQVTKQLEAFVEWDAFYPTGGLASRAPRHYAVGGLVYFLTPNLAVDVRTGVGLNGHSNDFLAGTGFAVRF